MSNTAATAPAEPTQTEVDVQQLIEIIENNLGDGQSLPTSGRIRIKSALHTVLSRRDEETTRLRAALHYANVGLSRAESIVSDDYGRGGGSNLPSWDCEEATQHLVDAQANVSAAMRGELAAPKSIATQVREALQALGVKYTLGEDGLFLIPGYGNCTHTLVANLVLEGGYDGAHGRTATLVQKDSPLVAALASAPEHA